MAFGRQDCDSDAGRPDPNPGGKSWPIRDASKEDAWEVARILARAFPSLYEGTFGKLDTETLALILSALFESEHLSLDAARVSVDGSEITGVMILNTGLPIGRGRPVEFWRLIRKRFGLLRAPRICLGGILANLMIGRRIPRAPDLVYIEALAVAESRRGRGVGTRLLADAEDWARSRGRSRIALHVLVANTGARRLYERTGFRAAREASTYRFARSLPMPSWASILMERRLPPAP